MSDARVGNFVQTPLGIGRLLSVDFGHAQVRFFRAPARSPYEDETFALQDVAGVEVSPHTRVYVNDGHRWRIGRLEGAHPGTADRYLVAFPNGEGAVLPTHAFDIRWAQPVADPFEILAAVGGDSPFVYQTRLDLLTGWSLQRRLAAGVEGLLMASVELHPHQLEVVRRVSQDTVKRYLLADEVGLGKTIEACAMIWQLLQRKPDARVLILAPAHLRRQWAEELVHRFRADNFDRAQVEIHDHHDDVDWPEGRLDLLVIDEAHHVTRAAGIPSVNRAKITKIAHEATDLLLLSATPVRSNEAGYLDLLHLLDPARYSPDDVAEFTKRVELRDQLALICQGLEPTLDAFDLSLYAEELRALFPADQALLKLLDTAEASDEGNRPVAIAGLRQHLSEGYRLHHRQLRTRRDGELERDFAVRGRKRAVPFIIPVPDGTAPARERMLDALRDVLLAHVELGDISENTAALIFRDVASRCGSLAPALMCLLTEDGQLDPVVLPALTSVLSEDEQTEVARDLLTLIRHENGAPLSALVPHLTRLAGADAKKRIVVATQYTAVAAAVADALGAHIGSRRVARHVSSQDARANGAAVTQWSGDNDCSVLICDSGAEEGLNLQHATALIHLDLPWETSRAEQRIGRCDRHAEDVPGPIPSLVVTYGTQPYAQAWLALLSDGANVFGQSVSSLQYVLADLEARLLQATLRRGFEAIEDQTDLHAEALQQELIRIKAHDALDALQPSSVGSTSLNDQLVASDRDAGMTRAFIRWLESVDGRVIGASPGVVNVSRRRLQVPLDLELALAPMMGTAIALNRRTAVRAQLPLPRAGHPQLDSVAEHMRVSDRGVAFALYRPSPEQWPPRIILRTDFLLAGDLQEQIATKAEALGVLPWLDQALQECLPVRVVTLAMDIYGGPVQDHEVPRTYQPDAGDRNLTSRPMLFRQLTQYIDWEELCGSALPLARARLAQHPALNELPQAAAVELHRRVRERIDRQVARLLNSGTPDQAQDATSLLGALPQRLDVNVSVLGCGAMIIADPSRLGSS